MRMYFGNYSDDVTIKKWIKDEIERKRSVHCRSSIEI